MKMKWHGGKSQLNILKYKTNLMTWYIPIPMFLIRIPYKTRCICVACNLIMFDSFFIYNSTKTQINSIHPDKLKIISSPF